jgi:hypothetical protein
MTHVRNIHHETPRWLQIWHRFELTASGIGMLLLLLLIAAVALYGG